MERGGDVTMILDDLKARKLAQSLDLKFTGTIGVLIKAKQQGRDISLEECIERFRACGFRLSAEVEAAMRRAAH
jgi:predicted nucleic acid-binding protein